MSDNTIPVILNEFTKLVLAIVDDNNQDPLWRRFYQLQMTSYFLSKKNFKFELEEAETAYDCIVKSWTDLKKYVENPALPIRDLDNLFKTVSIDFPSDGYTISESDNNDCIIYGSF